MEKRVIHRDDFGGGVHGGIEYIINIPVTEEEKEIQRRTNQELFESLDLEPISPERRQEAEKFVSELVIISQELEQRHRRSLEITKESTETHIAFLSEENTKNDV